MVLIKASGVREAIKAQDCNCSKEFIEQIDNVVNDIVIKSCNRAKGNNRKTVKGADL